MEQGSIASVFSSDEGGAKESYCSVARNDFDPQKSSVLSPQYERAKPPDRLSKELKDKANFTWGEEKPEYESSTHRDWRTTRESPPPPNVSEQYQVFENWVCNYTYRIPFACNVIHRCT